MDEKIVYLFDEQGRFNGMRILVGTDKDTETGEWIIPENATEAPMELSYKEHYIIKWDGEKWDYIEDPNSPPMHIVEQTPTEHYELPLSETKAEKIRYFKSIRDKKEVDPIEVNGALFDYDDKSRDRLYIARQALEDMGGGEAGILWTTADNKRIKMTVKDFAAVNSAAAIRSNQLHVKYNTLKEAVNECLTNEEVSAVVWEEND